MYGTRDESPFFSFAEGNNDHQDCGFSARPGSNGKESIFFFWKFTKSQLDSPWISKRLEEQEKALKSQELCTTCGSCVLWVSHGPAGPAPPLLFSHVFPLTLSIHHSGSFSLSHRTLTIFFLLLCMGNSLVFFFFLIRQRIYRMWRKTRGFCLFFCFCFSYGGRDETQVCVC